MARKNNRRFAVLGGAGTIGRIVVRDLFESHPDNRIVIADRNEKAAEILARSFRDKRVQAKPADAREPKKLTRLLKGQSVVINCLQHDFNLSVMGAALAARVHYVDLGGLFYWTQKQLELNKKFLTAGRTAVIGMGCSPGITNILVAYADSFLPKMESVQIRVGSVNFDQQSSGLHFTYSPQTIIEELTLEPWIWKDGGYRSVTPRTGWELTEFPEPVGKLHTLWTRHSEIATLPLSFLKRGLKYCDFKVGFEPGFVKEVMDRLSSGWTMGQFNELLVPTENPNDYEIARVLIDDVAIDCHAKAKPEWQASAGDIDTACPASIVAQMIADGAVDQPGVSPPELVVPVRPFFDELEKRGMKITHGR